MGDDGDQARAIRKHLADGGYRIAEVSVDFWDWAFNAPYVRCLEQSNELGLKGLHDTYLEHAAFALNWAEAAADDLFGRRVPHILLLHAGAFDAEMLDELLTRYEKMGVAFISLDEALADPVYQIVEIDEEGNGGTLFEHLLYLRETEHPPWFTHPYSLLDAMCSDG